MATPKKPKSEHKKRGRPSLYKVEYCEMLVAHMKKGKSFDTFGIEIGVHPDTVDDWAGLEVVEINGTKVERPRHPEFLRAKKEGFKASLKYWESLGVDLITGKIKGKAAVWIFTMKNRFKWTDRVENIVDDLRKPADAGVIEAEKSARLRLLMANPEARKLLEALQRIEENMLPKAKEE